MVRIATIAVGLIVDPWQAGAALQSGQADLIAVARQALVDPNRALNAATALADGAPPDTRFEHWPDCYGGWLSRHAKAIDRMGPWRRPEDDA